MPFTRNCRFNVCMFSHDPVHYQIVCKLGSSCRLMWTCSADRSASSMPSSASRFRIRLPCLSPPGWPGSGVLPWMHLHPSAGSGTLSNTWAMRPPRAPTGQSFTHLNLNLRCVSAPCCYCDDTPYRLNLSDCTGVDRQSSQRCATLGGIIQCRISSSQST